MADGNHLRELSRQLTSLVEAAAPSVVQVTSRHTRPGTGTVWGEGLVLAAVHGASTGDESTVREESGNVHAGEYLGSDPSSGLAVLRVAGLTAPSLFAGQKARPGQIAVSLGRTWSGALAASAGIVSVVGGPLRTGRGQKVEEVLRADVRVHPLGAGGPLVDADRCALAIATGVTLRGLPLFVPAAIAWAVASDIVAHGGIRRGYLGVSAHPTAIPVRQRAGRSQEVGLLVSSLASDGPAEQAGLLVGDLIVGFERQPVEDHDTLLSLLTRDRIGQPASLEVLRAGELRTVQVRVGER